jgi:hypothetical protein
MIIKNNFVLSKLLIGAKLSLLVIQLSIGTRLE